MEDIEKKEGTCWVCKKTITLTRDHIRKVSSPDGNLNKDRWAIPVCRDHKITFEEALLWKS